MLERQLIENKNDREDLCSQLDHGRSRIDALEEEGRHKVVGWEVSQYKIAELEDEEKCRVPKQQEDAQRIAELQQRISFHSGAATTRSGIRKKAEISSG
ncbi:hypothetical protein R1flu_029157 [Riccia fluitans]|uniref:Uncharacterized protein n=1 Tax=Riccia fluitans TaxID=41844 RepID=A0ABD1XNQ3_9MARC